MPFTPYPKNTSIYLCKGVPLDPDYAYTLLFHSNIEQYNVLSGYVYKTFNQQSYQRASSGALRIAEMAEELYDCNYLIFRNTAYHETGQTAKYFYAFVTDVIYINDHTSEIHYEIDVMQTYYFDYIMPACFVEREHSLTDRVGENIEPENLEIGEYVVGQYDSYVASAPKDSNPGSWLAVVFYSINKNNGTDPCRFDTYYWNGTGTIPTTPDPGSDVIINGVPQAYTYIAVPCNFSNLPATSVWLNIISRQIAEMSGQIVNIVLVPYTIWNDYNLTNPDGSMVSSPAPHSWTFVQELGFPYAHLANTNYIPKNKKLYTAPFSKLVLTNNQGESSEYRWEFFARTDYSFSVRANFSVYTTLVPDPSWHCVPSEYQGMTTHSYEQGLSVTNFPTVTWSDDSYSRWEAVNGTKWGLSMLGTVLSGAFSIGTGIVARNAAVDLFTQMGNSALAKGSMSSAFSNFSKSEKARMAGDFAIAHSGANTLMGVAELLAERKAARATPDTLKGSPSNTSVLMREGRFGFSAYGMMICGEMAETIDHFFSIFGYAVNRIKVPNVMQANSLTLRPVWNYIKTRNCIIIPDKSTVNNYGMNSECVKAIQNIFNNGITFWMNHQTVGRYNLDNPCPT